MKLLSFLSSFLCALVLIGCKRTLTNGTPYQITLYDDAGVRSIQPDESVTICGDYVVDLTEIAINPLSSSQGGRVVVKRDRCYYFELQR